MSDKGVFAVDRGIWDHPAFKRETFTRREAWIWLISEAAWKPHRKFIGGAMVDLQRGQLAHSIRHMAAVWKWSTQRVQTFLDHMKTDTMISTAVNTGITVVTICKYDEYQRVSLPRITRTITPISTPVLQDHHNREDIKSIEDKETILGDRVATRPRHPDRFEEFWREYPSRKGSNPKAPACTKFFALLKSGVSADEIVRGLKGYAIAEKDQIGTPFIKQATTFLNQRVWEGYLAPAVIEGPTVSPFRPPPGAPTREEILASYRGRNGHGNSENAAQPNGGDHGEELLREGAGVHGRDESGREKQLPDDRR